MVTRHKPSVATESRVRIREGHAGSPRYLELLGVFLLFIAVIGLLRVGTYETPPTWDAAMTVWPAAIEMSTSGPQAVLDMPTYEEGGPNTHTLSLITLLMSAAIRLVGASGAIVFGHVFNVLVLGLIGLVVFALVRARYSRWGAGIVGLAVITFPVMVGQSAYLYTDLPAALLLLLSMVMATWGRPYAAGGFAALAAAVKPLALIVVPVLWVITRRQGLPRSRSLASAALGLMGLMPALLVPSGSLGNTSIYDRIEKSVIASGLFLRYAPELLIIPLVALGLWLIALRKKDERTWAVATVVLVTCFVAFFFTNGILTPGYFALPRYFVFIVPPVLASAAIVISDQRKLAVGLMGVLVVLSLATVRGPFALGNESVVQPLSERSLAFVELFRMHNEGLRQLSDLSESMPVYYDHYSHYGVQYPQMNHLDGPIQDGLSPSLGRIWDESLSPLPDRFAMLLEYPWLGGEVLHDIHDAAVVDPDYIVETLDIAGDVDGAVEIAIITRLDR